MNPSRTPFYARRHHQGGFSLVETVLSLGIMSFGFLAMTSLLAVGLKTAGQARDNRMTSQIAQTLIEEAKEGALATGTVYLDFQGGACDPAQAAYAAQGTVEPVTTSPGGAAGTAYLSRLTLRITPVGAPDRARIYAVVYPAPQ